jgi:hypothetical protein
MATWHMDQWSYLERSVVTDPWGREWTVALMDLQGQSGDPEVPLAALGGGPSERYFTVVYSSRGTIQRERAWPSAEAARSAWEALLAGVRDGHVDPAQPEFREDLED